MSSSRRGGSRSYGPSPAQIERLQRQAERAQAHAEKEAAIARLQAVLNDLTTDHLQDFPRAQRPAPPTPPATPLEVIAKEATRHHLAGVSVFARRERTTAKEHAQREAAAYLADLEQQIRARRREWEEDAESWWRALNNNDEPTVLDAVNAAFSDNPAPALAVGVQEAVLSVVIRQPGLAAMPTQHPAVTPAGRPTLKKSSQRDRLWLWFSCLGSHVIATLKEAFAIAPAINAVDLAVITDFAPNSQLGVAVYGRWSRATIEGRSWRSAEDAQQFVDIGEDVASCIRWTSAGNLSASMRPVDVSAIPALAGLLDSAVEDDDARGGAALEDVEQEVVARHIETAQATDWFQLESLADWRTRKAREAGTPITGAMPPASHQQSAVSDGPAVGGVRADPNVVLLQQGQLVDLAQWKGPARVAFGCGTPEFDLSAYVVDANIRTTGDWDMVFHARPVHPTGCASMVRKSNAGEFASEAIELRLDEAPSYCAQIVLAVTARPPRATAELNRSELSVSAGGSHWVVRPHGDMGSTTVILGSLYRYDTAGQSGWGFAVLGQRMPWNLRATAQAYGIA
ncbi:MAG TPA: TerD family protein [Acidimicrobiales bacterium]|nr:TerD family protein [Acidimicrobiales bacterium]